MKRIAITSLALFFFNPLHAQKSQFIKVTYQVVEDLGKIGENKFDTWLLISKEKSQFIYNQPSRVVNNNNFRATIPAYKFIINHNLKNDNFEEQREMKKGKYLKAGWQNDHNWTISDETKKIGKYTVRKATTKSIELPENSQFYSGKAIAWFTEEIPIGTGPMRYAGLPGLILELEYENYNKKYILKDINFNTQSTFKDISNGIEVEKEDVIYFQHKNPKKITALLK